MAENNGSLEKDVVVGAREAMGLTQRELAPRIGRHYSTIHRYEQSPPVFYGWALVGYLYAQGRVSEAARIIEKIEQKDLAL